MCATIALDIKKAFDFISRDVLFKKLEAYNIELTGSNHTSVNVSNLYFSTESNLNVLKRLETYVKVKELEMVCLLCFSVS